MSDWDQVVNDFLVRLGLLDFVSEDEQTRDKAVATAVDPSIPPPGAPVNWISIETFQQLLYARLQGTQAANAAKRAFIDSHLDKLFSAAVQRSQEVRNNVMSLAQWLVSSVTTENLLPIFGTLRYDDLYGRIKAIRTRFRTSNRHGVILCVTKLLELKMTKDSQPGCHQFMDQIRSWMLRLRTYLAAGNLSLAEVLEIMVLIQGLPKHGGWPVPAMSLSTDETLSFSTMCERLQQQADRLAADKTSKNSNTTTTQAVTTVGNAKAISGGSAGGSSGGGGSGGGKVNKSRTPYWQGQQAKATYQDIPQDSDTRSQSSTQSQTSTQKKKQVKWKGKGKGKGKSSGHSKSTTGRQHEDTDEEGFIFQTTSIESDEEVDLVALSVQSLSDVVVSESHPTIAAQEVRNDDEWSEIQDSDLYDFLDDVRTDEVVEKWMHQQVQIEQMMEQPFNYLSILRGGSEPVGSTPIVDFNLISCANHVVMVEESDDDVPDLVDPFNDNGTEQRSTLSSHRVESTILDDVSDIESIGEIVDEMMPSIDQRNVNGSVSGKSRIVPAGFIVATEYVDNDSESDTSELPDLISYSTSESEYVYSDEDSFTSLLFSDNDGDNSDSDESNANEYVLVDDTSTIGHCKMVVDISQDSDSDEESESEEVEPAPDNLVWLHPEQIIARDSLNTIPVHHDLFRQLNNSGMFVEEIVRYIHYMVERCHDIETSGEVGRMPVDRRPSDHGIRQMLGQIVGLIGTEYHRELQAESTESSIVSIYVVDDPEVVVVTDEVNDSVTSTPGGDQVVEGSIPSGSELSNESISTDSNNSEVDTSSTSTTADNHQLSMRSPETHAIYIDNISRSHRIFYQPGLRMFPEVRCQVAIMPRELPDRC